MILERLLVVNGRLNGHRAVDEESVAYFHTRHQIVVAAGMLKLCVSTQEKTILNNVITAACTQVKNICVRRTNVLIAHFSIKHQIVSNEVTSLGIHSEAEFT